jgi:AbrB family looped-hinge helix DNA binding protein
MAKKKVMARHVEKESAVPSAPALRQWPGRVTSGGRLVLPAELRAELGLRDGDAVSLRLEGQQIVVEPYAHVVKRIQDKWRRHIPPDRSLVDELIAERRAEAARD